MTPSNGDLMLEVAKQVPALAVLVFLVIVFLRSMAKRDDAASKVAETCHASHEATSNRLAECVDRNSIAIDKNSSALGKNGETLDGLRQAVKDAVRDGLDRTR